MDGILKPNYNTVDLSEIELVDSDGGPRENDTNLMTVSCPYFIYYVILFCNGQPIDCSVKRLM